MLTEDHVKRVVSKLKQVRYKDLVRGNRSTKLVVLSLHRNYKDLLPKISSITKLYKTISFDPKTKLLSFMSHHDKKVLYRNHMLDKFVRGRWVPGRSFSPNSLVGWRGPFYLVRPASSGFFV